MKVIALLLLVLIPNLAQAASFDEASLKVTMGKMIQLIEGKKYKELIEQYTDPARVEKVKRQGNFDKMAAEFGNSDKAVRLKDSLNKALKEKPTLDKNAHTATFVIPGVDRSMVFDFNKDRWLLRN